MPFSVTSVRRLVAIKGKSRVNKERDLVLSEGLPVLYSIDEVTRPEQD